MKNNFNLIRLILALIVVCYHLSVLGGIKYLSFFSGEFAVKCFFVISGYLIIQSYERSNSLTDFAIKRVRRIYPAYVCAILLCLGIGLYATNLSAMQFMSFETLKYIVSNLLLLNFLHPTLPGVFTHNVIPAMDGSLWTIKLEVALYCCIPGIYWLYKKYDLSGCAAVIAMLSAMWIVIFRHHEIIARQFPAYLSYFALGCFFAKYKYLDMSFVMMLFYGAIFFASKFLLPYAPFLMGFNLVIEPFFYASLIVYLATQVKPLKLLDDRIDISYGIYLYHFPIIQLFVSKGWNPLGAIPTVLTIALISWIFVEELFLRRNR